MLSSTLMSSSCLLQNSQTQSLQTLSAMVSHFQKLFDVNSLNGVYPRMNEVYTKLGEMTNAMRNLHELLELGKDLPPAAFSHHSKEKRQVKS